MSAIIWLYSSSLLALYNNRMVQVVTPTYITCGPNSELEDIANIKKILRDCYKIEWSLGKKRVHSWQLAPEVQYLGHKITKEGIEPTEKEAEAVLRSPYPTNVSALKAFQALINFYSKFLSNVSTILNHYIHSYTKIRNGAERQSSKKHLGKQSTYYKESPIILAHYNHT